MPATNRLRHVAQWQNCPVKPPDIVAARCPLLAQSGHSRHRNILSAIGCIADIAHSLFYGYQCSDA
jgi:hypothetical protein